MTNHNKLRHDLALHGVLLETFIASSDEAPQELVLDIDATHVPLYGQQEGAHFHFHYDNYCYLPLYVFCGQDMLARRLRQIRPGVCLVVRADSGFCRPRAIRRFDAWGINYTKNPTLLWQVAIAERALAP